MGAIKINGATSGSTTITAPATGGDESIELSTALASKLDVAGGKILQIVRATDSTNRTTTSTSFVDVTGMSVTISPVNASSNLIIVASFPALSTTSSSSRLTSWRLTDSSNNPLEGAESQAFGLTALTIAYDMWAAQVLIGYAAATDTSSRSYKLQFSVSNTSISAEARFSTLSTGQMYAIEVSA